MERSGAAGGTERNGARGARADSTETEDGDLRPKVESPKDSSARGWRSDIFQVPRELCDIARPEAAIQLIASRYQNITRRQNKYDQNKAPGASADSVTACSKITFGDRRPFGLVLEAVTMARSDLG